MTKTEALKVAANAHGAPMGRGTSWCFYAPYYSKQPSGPSTEVRATSYSDAAAKRARRVASMALELMGYSMEDAESLTYDQRGSARDILANAVARQPNV